ncbi:MAG: hypothetical protein IKZ62_09335 [Prevotella sp.]|nr:hypothetical protein [Prevotella sp.]
MKINKYILGLAVAVLGGLSSCNTDAEGTLYNSDLEHVTFDGTSTSVSLSVDESSTTIPVTINRGVVANASTITFKAEASEEGIFSNDANGTVTFAPGQNTATFNVTAANLEKEKSYTYTLSLSDAAIATADTITKVTQNKVYTIKVKREGDWTAWEEWNEKGTAVYKYSGIISVLSGDQPNLKFTYRHNVLNENLMQFKLEAWGKNVELILNYDKSTGVVSCAPQFTGVVSSDYGDVYISDIPSYFPPEDVTPEDYGSFDEEQGIIKIPIVYFVDAGYFGWGSEYVYIDGYERSDYSMTVAYFGKLTTSEDQNFLLADITFAKDVEYVLYALATADKADATLAGLIDGSIAGEKLKESGRVQVPVTEPGTYYLIAVAFAGGKAVNSEAAKIKFGVVEETWTPKFIGEYEYTVKDYTDDGESEPWGGWYPAGTKVDAILYQSDSDETRWKIAPWADLEGEEGLIFTMDENTGIVTVDQVYTGYTSAKNGEFFASDFVTYGVGNYPSGYDDGVFYFNLAYHNVEEPFCLVMDTFTLTGAYEASSRAAKAISKAKRSNHKMTLRRGCKLAPQYFAPILKNKSTLKKK